MRLWTLWIEVGQSLKGLKKKNRRKWKQITIAAATTRMQSFRKILEAKLQEILQEPRFGPDRVDIKFLRKDKVEIDAVLTKAGAAEDPKAAEKIWNYIMDILKQEFKKRNYNRAISDERLASLVKHYAEIIRKFRSYTNNHGKKIRARGK
jgi:hypothetical protein